MGRVRKKSDQWMPQRVYRGKSAYEWHPKDGGCVRLCELKSSKSVVWRRYEEEVAKRSGKNTFEAVVAKYFASDKFKSLSPTTQKDYIKHSKKVLAVFGKTNPYKIERQHIIQYKSIRGEQSATQCNRELAFISLVFNWSMENVLFDLQNNPCKGVTKIKVKPRDRYIEDWEYELLYNHASNPVIRGIIEVSYLCAARQGDVLELTKDQLRDEGIYIRQGKTGKKQIKAWTPRLRKAVDDALAHHNAKSVVTVSRYVFNTNAGTKYSSSGFVSAFSKLRDRLKSITEKPLDFTFHDIKAKSISDFDGNQHDKQQFSGHMTSNQVNTYDRKVAVVPSLDKPIPRRKK